ncbi:MAG: helix-hairpin-helix domain-containing protein [Halieaceae bacterium]|jgi:competence protein ComEA|nr:helix-hairpin-helix domain-containing protein [Halieaceae bacterium]
MDKTGMYAASMGAAMEPEGLGTNASRSGWLAALFVVVLLAVAGSAFAQDSVVNVNTATPEELSQVLMGVGLAKARRIVEYREMHGPFEHPDELAEVRGIGPATVDKNRERIELE